MPAYLDPYLDDEEVDEYGNPIPKLGQPSPVVSPELRRIIGTARKPDLGTPPIAIDRLSADRRVAEAIKAKPEAPKPKWWQRALAGAAGGMAGYVNASGRTRIDPTAAVEGIYGVPGYRQKLSDWANNVQAAQTEAQAAKGAEDSWYKRQQLESEMESREAQAERDRAAAAYDTRRADLEQNQWKIDSKGRIYNTITGEVKTPAPTAEERMAEAKKLGADEEQARYYALNGKMPEPQKPAAPTRPVSVAPGATLFDTEKNKPIYTAPRAPKEPASNPTQFRYIETKKSERLIKAERDTRARVANGEDEASAYADLENQKQQIQDAYEAEIAAAGGQPEHFEYPEPAKKTPQPTGGRGGARPEQPAKPAADDGQTIRVRRKSDGQTGTIPVKNFDPAKYDRI